MNFLLDYLRAGDVFVDVGANVGVYALLGSAVAGVDVWAFEPSSETSESIRSNVALNGLGNTIHVVQAAVGAASGDAMLSVGLASVNHVVGSAETIDAEVVPLVTLDDYLPGAGKAAMHALKIDVEGAELAVLEGARLLIEANRPPIIVEANDVAGLAAWLSSLGYSPYTYLPDRRELVQAEWVALPSGNFLAIADLPLATERLGVLVAPVATTWARPTSWWTAPAP